MYDLSRRIFPLVYYLLPPLMWLGLLKHSPWSSEWMLQERSFIKLATGKTIMKQNLSFHSPCPPPLAASQFCDLKTVVSLGLKFFFSYIFQACCDLREVLTCEGPTARRKSWVSQHRIPAFNGTVAVMWTEVRAQTHVPTDMALDLHGLLMAVTFMLSIFHTKLLLVRKLI